MRTLWITAAAAASISSAGAAQAAELLLDDVVARVVVISEARSDIAVQVQPGRSGLAAPQVERGATGVRVSGGHRVNHCDGNDGAMRVRIRGEQQISIADAPVITVRAPRDVQIRKIGGAVVGQVDRTSSLNLSSGGCAHWTVANVEGELTLEQSGGSRAIAGQSRTARLRASGGGSIRLQSTGALDAQASGGGVVRVNAVSGPVEAAGSGGGGVKIAGGRAGRLVARASGGGYVDHDGVAASLDARASGGGRVSVAEVTGEVNRSSSGGGSVSVGR
jgi:hypothetical protein